MAFSFKWVQKINETDNLCVSGYIRKCEEFLHCDVPVVINHITLCYYNNVDSFNHRLLGDGMIITDDAILKMIKDDRLASTAYLSNTVKAGVYKWKFKIKFGLSSCPILDIGVCKVRFSELKTNGFCFALIANKSYAFDLQKGKLYDPECRRCWMSNTDKIKCYTDDIIQMILDLNELTLRFVVNDYILDTIVKIEETEYIAAITLRGKGNAVQLIKSNYQ